MLKEAASLEQRVRKSCRISGLSTPLSITPGISYRQFRHGKRGDPNTAYEEFAARVRRRQQGVDEGHDPEEEGDYFDYD